MTQYINKEQVIEWVKQRLIPTVTSGNYDDWERGANNERINFLSYIDSLPEEPASEDLEEEITKCYKSRNDLMMTRKQFGELIHHFAEWQRKKDEQESKVLFEKSSGDCPKELIDIIDKEFGIDGRDENDNPLNGFGDWQCGMILNGPAISKLVKLGVEWQKEQRKETLQTEYEKGRFDIREEMMKDAVDATILDVNAQTIEFGLWPEKLLDIKEGDKVKIIIIKEN